MFTKISVSAISAAVVAAAAFSAAPASAASAPLSNARIAVHFDLAAGQQPENIVLAPGGGTYVTLSKARQVAEISATGVVKVLATLPAPADGGVSTPVLHVPFTAGLVRDHNGTLYFLYATGSADLTGVWRLRPGGQPQRIAALPADSFPNGLALDPRTQRLYVTDSVLGVVWTVPVAGGTPTVWSSAPQLARISLLGANGLKVHNGAVWVTNDDKGTILRIPILPNGSAGQVDTEATGLPGIDDFAFTGRGDQLLAAIDSQNEIALVQPDGSYSIVLTQADGLDNPSSVALRGDTVYVTSAAFAGDDPNLLTARFNR
jgi:hypothetical protein